MFQFSLLTSYAYDVLEPVAKWLTVAVLAAMIIAGIILYFAKREVFGKYLKYGVFSFFAYALVLGILMLILQLIKRTDPNYLEDKWLNADVISYVLVPLLVLFAFVLLGGIILFVISKMKPETLKPFGIAYGVLFGAGAIAAAVTIGLYFGKHISDDGYYSEFTDEIALYVSAGVLAAVTVTAALLLGLKDKKKFDSRAITLAGICIAMSFGLSYVKLFDMPFGGSITLVSLFPVMLYSYIYGTKKGILIGFIYGLMQAMQDPYIIHPAQFVLDYPLAFSFVAFAGTFKNLNALRFPQLKFALGALLTGTLRFSAHVLSGVFAFGANAAAEGFENFWIYSTGYNSYVFIDIALVIAAGVLVLSSKAFLKQTESYSGEIKKQPETVTE